jgi:beta-N-acetylhexosaminidase
MAASPSTEAPSTEPRSAGSRGSAHPVGGRRPAAVVYGCAGPVLSGWERDFFRDAQPFGFILFKRNCEDPDQLRRLVADLRAAVGRRAPVLIDQEGGRVARLRPPHWPSFPPARRLGEVAEADLGRGLRAAWLHGRLLAALLADVGIDVDCAPVADVPVAGAHDVIGDRAFARDPLLVAALARELAHGLMAGGVLPVVKHIPGHGRAHADSHKALPVVKAGLEALRASDFAAFRLLADLPLGMSAHVVYRAVDPAGPGTTSATVIGQVVRGWIGFDGLLFSDDLSMQALSGSHAERAAAVLRAGCDVVLHCSGISEEMVEIAGVAPILTEVAAARWQRARDRIPPTGTVDLAALRAEFEGLVGPPGGVSATA